MRINKTVGNVNIKIDTKRIDKNIRNAQAVLNEAVGNDCKPLVPHLNGGLQGSFRYGNGDIHSGFVEWTAPYSHFQYVGFVRTDERGRVWVGEKEEKPILHKDWPLDRSKGGGESEWFEVAKKNNLKKWEKLVKYEVWKG
ncbi:MAG: minor capsid protein [Lachnospiraceae bacterium]|nr:minor capsid protein [Lachnospiraceae bacterium]